MFAVHSIPMPFFLLIEICSCEAVKKHVESGFLDTTVYHLLAMDDGLLPRVFETAMKHLVRFEGYCLTCCKRISSSLAVHFL